MEIVNRFGGWSQAFAIRGSYAYIAIGSRLTILDISDPSSPIMIGMSAELLYAMDMVISGDYAYIANYGSLEIINILDPSNPFLVGSYDSIGIVYGVAVDGNYVYLADGSDGLRILDVTNPMNPTEIGFYDTPGDARNIRVSGNYAFIADYDTLQIINISNPEYPYLVGFYNSPGTLYDVFISGIYAYLSDGNLGLRIVDISNPANPQPVGFCDTPGTAYDVVVSELYAYVADGSNGLQIINIQNPTNPYIVGFYDNTDTANAVAISGNYVYVDDFYSLEIVDISNPAQPFFVGFYNALASAWDVVISGEFAYIADVYTGLQVLDISNPAVPVQSGHCDIPDLVHSVTIFDSYAFISAQNTGLWLVDISDPHNPFIVSNYDTSGNIGGVEIASSHAFITDGESGLLSVNISNPAFPYLTGTYDTPGIAEDVAISGDYAFVADGSYGVRVINISNPTNLFEVGAFITPGVATGIVVSGNYIYVVESGGILRILSIAIPYDPYEVGIYNTSSFLGSVYVSGNYAYLADSWYGLRILNISDPSYPTEVGYYSTGGWAQSVATYGNYVFVTHDSGGIFILRFVGGGLGHTIYGHIADLSGNPINGVTVNIDPGYSTYTDNQGNFVVYDVIDGSYTITPNLIGYTFNPINRTISLPPDSLNVDFTAIPLQYSRVITSLSGYNGVSNPYSSNSTRAINLPVFMGNSPHIELGSLTTEIYILNLDPSNDCLLSLHFVDMAGNFIFNYDDQIPANSSKLYDPELLGVPQGFQGSLITESTSAIAVNVDLIRTNRNSLLNYSGNYGSTNSYVAHIIRNWAGMNSEIWVQNTDLEPNDVTIEFFPTDSGNSYVINDTIPAFASHEYRTIDHPELGANFIGWVKITAERESGGSGSIYSIAEEWDQDSDYAAAYEGIQSSSNNYISTKQIKEVDGLSSLTRIVNISDNLAHFSANFYNLDGSYLLTISLPVTPYGSVDLNLADIPYIPSGFDGSFDLTADQPVVGVTTLVGDLDANTDEYAQFLLSNTDAFESLIFPRLGKSIADGKSSEFSFINNSTSTVPTTVVFYNQNGIESTRLSRSVTGMSTVRFSTYEISALGNDWDGYVKVLGPAGSQLIPGEIIQINRSVQKRAWTIMYYLAGDNNIPYELLTYEENKLMEGSNNSNLYIPIFRDGIFTSSIYEAYADGKRVIYISKGELDTGYAATLSDFVVWAKHNFPAEHYALVITDHGHGLKGTSVDYSNDMNNKDPNYLDPKEFRIALINSGPIDVLFMRNCLTANLEHAYQARSLVSYYVASEAQAVAPIDHRYLVPISNNTSAEQLAIWMAEAYYLQYNNTGLQRTISVGDISNVISVAERTNEFASVISSYGLGQNIWQIITGDLVQRFDDDNDGSGIDTDDILADLYHFAQLVGGLGDLSLTTAANNLMTAIDEYIIYDPDWTGNDFWDYSNAHGLSILLTKDPACYYNTSSFDFAGAPSWYCDQGMQTINQGAGEWGQMLSDLITEFNPNPQPQFEPPPLVPLDTSFPNVFLPLIVRSTR